MEKVEQEDGAEEDAALVDLAVYRFSELVLVLVHDVEKDNKVSSLSNDEVEGHIAVHFVVVIGVEIANSWAEDDACNSEEGQG